MTGQKNDHGSFYMEIIVIYEANLVFEATYAFIWIFTHQPYIPRIIMVNKNVRASLTEQPPLNLDLSINNL
jgi:hypothetical protein